MNTPLLAAAALLAGALAAFVAGRTTLVPRSEARVGLLTASLAAPLLGLLLYLLVADETTLVIAASAIALGVLLGATLADLRERFVDIITLVGGAAAALALFFLAGQERGVMSLFGLLVGTGLSGLLFLGGWLFARARGAGIDPATGERVEDVGSGDVFAWAMVGAWLGGLGGPGAVLFAFMAQVFLNGFISAGVLIWARARRHEGDLHLPMLPSIAIAAVGVAIWGAHF